MKWLNIDEQASLNMILFKWNSVDIVLMLHKNLLFLAFSPNLDA